jgi:long-chain acyl-CoA synthetase
MNRQVFGGAWRGSACFHFSCADLVEFLLEADEDIGVHDLRYIICGAGTLALTLAQRFEARFGVRLLHGYGLSDTTAFATDMPPQLSAGEHRYWLSEFGYPAIGVAFGAHEVAIHDAQGRALPPGERGEIVVRGHDVMLGYFRRPDANALAFEHGWFRSGDEGFCQRDAQGREFFFITDG